MQAQHRQTVIGNPSLGAAPFGDWHGYLRHGDGSGVCQGYNADAAAS